MHNPFVMIAAAADFVVRPLLNIYLSFLLFVVAIGLLSRLLARALTHPLPSRWHARFLDLATLVGALIAALSAPRLLYYAPHWLR